MSTLKWRYAPYLCRRSFMTGSVLPASPKNHLRKSLSTPMTSQPSSHRSRVHSEPISPPAPVMRAFLDFRTLFMDGELNMDLGAVYLAYRLSHIISIRVFAFVLESPRRYSGPDDTGRNGLGA